MPEIEFEDLITHYVDAESFDLGELLVLKVNAAKYVPWLNRGGLWGAGDNSFGILGNNNTINRSSPVQTVSGGLKWHQVSLKYSHAAAIKTDKSLWLWGENSQGQLGTNNTVNRSSPVQTVLAGNDWFKVDTNMYFTGAIKLDGSLWMWGYNAFGQLGTGNTVNKSSPVQVINGGEWDHISLGQYHSIGIKTGGSLWAWGNNGYGQMGLGYSDLLNPVTSPVHCMNGVITASAGSTFTVIIGEDSRLYGMGDNSSYCLTDYTGESILDDIELINPESGWSQVSSGFTHVLAIKDDRTLWGWGAGYNGELGDGYTVVRSAPIQISAEGDNWAGVSAGNNCSAGIKLDGSLWLWGDNTYGQLMNNDGIHRSSLIQIITRGNYWYQVSCGGAIMAIAIP